MMIHPPITELVDKIGSRYLLTVQTAKRARQLTEGQQPLSKASSKSNVSIAAQEIYEDKLSYITTPDLGNL